MGGRSGAIAWFQQPYSYFAYASNSPIADLIIRLSGTVGHAKSDKISLYTFRGFWEFAVTNPSPEKPIRKASRRFSAHLTGQFDTKP
ncbi:MAG TPA: hypothetical protein VED17_06025 [Nitrososphaerales archaeon]|nr:hypothetical protein [Nitrososphaerales archaeon]